MEIVDPTRYRLIYHANNSSDTYRYWRELTGSDVFDVCFDRSRKGKLGA